VTDEKRADLHTHTTASDGLDDPATLIAHAESVGLAAIAITDHDSVDSLTSAAVSASSLAVIPGIEMSANVGHREVHILGYFVDPSSTVLNDALAGLRGQRLRRVERFCERLTEIGLPITIEEVLRQATGESVGRPHIARAMIARGYVETVGQAFDLYLAGGRPGFVARDDVTPEWSIALIHAAGGAAVMAHPFTTFDPPAMVDALVIVGLDGIEVEYGSYDEEHRAILREIANERGLIQTGGSDYHGPAHREDSPLGSGTVSLSVVEELSARSRRYR
jgi:predicted metal-dependent phosphoesterase TrpH